MTWTAPDVDRTFPPDLGEERESLDAWLDFHRATLLWKCGSLTPERLAIRPVATSTLSLLGLVRHMAYVEMVWFRIRFLAEDVTPIYWCPDQPDADFAIFASEVERARGAARGRSLDDRFTYRDGRVESDLRWIYIHMIEEYARHNGHADLIRELIDGSTGD